MFKVGDRAWIVMEGTLLWGSEVIIRQVLGPGHYNIETVKAKLQFSAYEKNLSPDNPMPEFKG